VSNILESSFYYPALLLVVCVRARRAAIFSLIACRPQPSLSLRPQPKQPNYYPSAPLQCACL
jgi:hypothetical protein